MQEEFTEREAIIAKAAFRLGVTVGCTVTAIIFIIALHIISHL